jgi:hemolysin III
MKPPRPLLRGHFHQAMFFVSLGACVLLMLKSKTTIEMIATSVYSLGVFTMFGVSSLYHRITWQPTQFALMKQLDHSAIFIKIAGTFTPICLLVLQEPSRTRLLVSIWAVSLIGISQKLLIKNFPRSLSVLIYLFAGYLAVPYLSELQAGLGNRNLALIIAGGVVYTLGALCYGLKWPKLNPQIFGYHEVFHILVNIGAILHFAVIYSLV